MLEQILIPVLTIGTALGLSVPLGYYLAGVLDGRKPPTSLLGRVEGWLDTGPQDWKRYGASLLAFNTVMFVVGFGVLAGQHLLPLDPDRKSALAPSTVFHTTISFFANNSQQHYSGEVHLSYLSQLVAIIWNMLTGGATGLCALAATIRALRGDAHLGNFYVDLWRSLAYDLVPVSLAAGLLLIVCGVPMTFEPAAQATTVEEAAMGKDNEGKANPQTIARGPVAALVPAKNLASVGGGFFGANSAHPLENPSALSNFVECALILLFPAAQVIAFGVMLRRPREGVLLFGVMLVLLVGMTALAMVGEGQAPNPGLAGLPVDQEGLGNLEGKELRFGSAAPPTWVAVTTAVSCGSVNCAHDSLQPLTQLVALSGMWLGCVFGGLGSGLLMLLVYLFIAVFLAGLMVGRTPEYLGRKVEAHEMKLAALVILVPPVLILLPCALFLVTDWGPGSTTNPGAHGFSQILYEFTSATSGNGSGLEGLGDTWGFWDNRLYPYSLHWDIACGLVILLGRFVPLLAVPALASSLGRKPAVPPTRGTLRTDTWTFGVLLLTVVLLLGGLLYLPAAALGPIAELVGPSPFGR
jgi:K+-transporting ATPase ATPase A chain